MAAFTPWGSLVYQQPRSEEAALQCHHKTDTLSLSQPGLCGSLAVKQTGWPQFKNFQITELKTGVSGLE